MLHAVRAAMKSLRETGTDFSSAQGMGPKEFFAVMGESWKLSIIRYIIFNSSLGLHDVVALDSKAGGKAFVSI